MLGLNPGSVPAMRVLCPDLYPQPPLVLKAEHSTTSYKLIEIILSIVFILFFFYVKQKESGHLSYACPKNMLGEREPPKKKEKKKKKKVPEPEEEVYVSCTH